MDFAALCPEINSGLMYTGPGSGPMLAAAAAWDELAATLYATASSYGSLISDVSSAWLGPSSNSMAAAAAPYVSWLSSTAGLAETTGAQAKAAAAAYETAFALTVPPPVIAANRALLAALIATNFFGQNTPAIMATEALYAEMWAQDAAAMYGYQGLAAAASTFSPFAPPPPTTSETASAGQATALAQAVSTPAGASAQTVSPLASGATTPLASAPLTSAAASNSVTGAASTAATTTSSAPVSSFTGVTSSTAALTSASGMASGTGSSATMGTTGLSMLSSANTLMNSMSPAAGALSSQIHIFGSALPSGVSSGALGSVGNAATSASVGRAATLGMLSVPQNWTTAAPAFSQFSQVSSVLPTTGANAVPAVSAANPSMLPPPLSTLIGRESSPMVSTARFDVRPTVVQRPVAAG